MRSIRLRHVYLWLFLIASLLGGCSPKSTPPGASTFGGSVEGTLYSYHYWEEGLAILIWHDFSYGSSGCNGTASTVDPVYRLTCDVIAQDGRTFTWEVHSSDGVTAQIWINGQSYDLDQGTLFLVNSQADNAPVSQLQRDLSGLEPDYESIAALASSDTDIASFVESAIVR